MSPWPLALALTVPFQEPWDELLAEMVGRKKCLLASAGHLFL